MSDAGKRLAAQIGRFSLGVLGGLLTGVIVLVTALYTVLDPKPLVRGVVMAAPVKYRRLALRIVVGVSEQVQAWARATLWLMVIVGVACGLGLWAIGVRSALLFGILAGVGEAIPTIGPILTAIPPALVAFADEPTKALWVLGLFLAVQQLEQHLLVPRIMAAALRLHPVSVLFFVVALGGLLGPLGVLLATPLCAAVKVAYREIRADAQRKRLSEMPGAEEAAQ
jgi:predicted PurR-regulated permease PerM